MDEVQVDVEDRGLACGFGDEVLLPDFFEERAGCGVCVVMMVSWLRQCRLVCSVRCGCGDRCLCRLL